MISDKDIRQVYAEQTGFDTESGHGSDIAISEFARAVYKLGQKHQRDSDATLCKNQRIYTKIGTGEKYLAPYIFDGDRHEGVIFAEAILKSKGD